MVVVVLGCGDGTLPLFEQDKINNTAIAEYTHNVFFITGILVYRLVAQEAMTNIKLGFEI